MTTAVNENGTNVPAKALIQNYHNLIRRDVVSASSGEGR